MLRSFLLLLLMSTSVFAENYFIHIPSQYRQHNSRNSCVHASVTNCLRIVGLGDTADKFWATYKGDWNGENSQGISFKLDKFNIKHVIVHDEQSLINAVKCGRGAAVTWAGRHCVTLIGIRNGNAYLLENEGSMKYHIQSWAKFLSSWKRSGHWAVIVLSGQPAKMIKQKNLGGFDD